MSGVYMLSLAQMTLTLALVCGVAFGWALADVIELYWVRLR